MSPTIHPLRELALVKEYDLFIPLYYNDAGPLNRRSFKTCSSNFSAYKKFKRYFAIPLSGVHSQSSQDPSADVPHFVRQAARGYSMATKEKWGADCK